MATFCHNPTIAILVDIRNWNTLAIVTAPDSPVFLPNFEVARFIAGSAKSGTTSYVAFRRAPRVDGLPRGNGLFPPPCEGNTAMLTARCKCYLMETAESRLLFARESTQGNRDYAHFSPRKIPAGLRGRGERTRQRQPGPAGHHGRVLRTRASDLRGFRHPMDRKTPANRYCLPDIRSRFPNLRDSHHARPASRACCLPSRNDGLQLSMIV